MLSMPRLISLAVMLLVIVILGIVFLRVIAPFLMPLFLAGITAVICQPLFRYLLQRTGDRIPLAAGLTTTAVMAIWMVPLIIGVLVASLQLYAFATTVADSPRWKSLVSEAGQKAQTHSLNFVERSVEFVNQFLPDEEQRSAHDIVQDLQQQILTSLHNLGDRSLGQATGKTVGALAGVAGSITAALIGLVIFAMALYYFLADGAGLTSAAEHLIPVHAEYQRQLLEQFSKVVRSVVLGMFAAALAQGVATGIALWFFGFPFVFVLFVLATLAALIPIVGAWLVWFPCVVVLFIDGHWGQGSILFLYGAVFVGILDNVIRTYMLNADTKLHPLLAFISILGGMQALGLWGVFIGPIVASCLHAVVKIFNTELRNFSNEQQQTRRAPSAMSHAEELHTPTPPVEPTPDEAPVDDEEKPGTTDSIARVP